MCPSHNILIFLNKYGNINTRINAECLFYQIKCNIGLFSLLLRDLESKEIIKIKNLNILPNIANECYFPEVLNNLNISLTEKGKHLVNNYLIGDRKNSDFENTALDSIKIDNASFNLSGFKSMSFEEFYSKYKGQLQRDAVVIYYLLTGKKISNQPFTVFISYSWENDEHKKWVLSFARKLKEKSNFNVILDQLDFKSGMHTYETMRSSIIAADKVLIILTPEYKLKAENNIGGVGYEASIINSDLFKLIFNKKYIPILRSGERKESTPEFMTDYFDFDARKKVNYKKLILDINSSN